MTDLSYPIGRFNPEVSLTVDDRARLIDRMAGHPSRFRAAVEGLTSEQLDTPYRPGGWTVRQLLHHVPESHLNSYIRFKWALTEENPVIKAYDQDAWADTFGSHGDVEPSLDLLEALHARWVSWLRDLSSEDWSRTFQHPEWGSMSLEMNLQLYAWHGEHHLAHIRGLRERMGW
jgi:hypothetical protein